MTSGPLGLHLLSCKVGIVTLAVRVLWGGCGSQMRSRAWSALQTAKSGPIMRDYDCYYYPPIVTALAQEATKTHTQAQSLVLIEGADRWGLGHGGCSSLACGLAHRARLPAPLDQLPQLQGATLGGQAEMLTVARGRL